MKLNALMIRYIVDERQTALDWSGNAQEPLECVCL